MYYTYIIYKNKIITPCDKMALDICMASDDNFAIHLGISIISIMENNDSDINVHILNDKISQINIDRLKTIEERYPGLNLYFYDIHKYFKENDVNYIFNETLKDNDFFNLLGISTFSRLFLEDIIPKDIEKILYLDCDTVVLNDLNELFAIELDENLIAGVIDIMANINKHFYKGQEKKTPFINAGVLLINLRKWRELKFAKLSIDLLNKYPDKSFLNDQNIINILCGEDVIIMDPKFNTMSEFFYVDYEKNLKINEHFASVERFYNPTLVENALKNPTIVHFLSQVWDRPWMSQIGLFKHSPKNPYNESYLHYKSLSPWKDEPIQENTKNFTQKAYYEAIRFIMMHFPANILANLFDLKNR